MTTITASSTFQTMVTKELRFVYIGLFCGVLLCLTLRNVFLRLMSLVNPVSISEEKPGTNFPLPVDSPSRIRTAEHWLYTRYESIAGFTPVELLLILVVVVVNTSFVLVTSTKVEGIHTSRLNTPRSVALRCASTALANLPIVFSLTGRNSVVQLLTGIGYQHLRFPHKVFGYTLIFLVWVHFLGMTLSTLTWTGMEGLASLFKASFVKWGILTLLSFTMIGVFSLSFVRKVQYELFLATHMIGASLVLVGIYYHRVNLQSWVYAAIAIYALERFFRLIRLFTSNHRSPFLISFRKPFSNCTATLVHGAIVLRIPVPKSTTWKAGQHCYLSFHNLKSLKTSLFQSHPFSIMNLPSSSLSKDPEKGELVGESEMMFVMKVRKGMTLALANSLAQQELGCKLFKVSVEGPYGGSNVKETFGNVLLIAGGSGITHILSKLASIVAVAERNLDLSTNIKLVWVFRHIEQSNWINLALTPLLEKVSRLPNLTLETNYYVTQGQLVNKISSFSSIKDVNNDITSGLEEIDDKDENKFTTEELAQSSDYEVLVEKGIVVIDGRPELITVIDNFAEKKVGQGLIVGCGPEVMMQTIRTEVLSLTAYNIVLEIASFEC